MWRFWVLVSWEIAKGIAATQALIYHFLLLLLTSHNNSVFFPKIDEKHLKESNIIKQPQL